MTKLFHSNTTIRYRQRTSSTICHFPSAISAGVSISMGSIAKTIRLRLRQEYEWLSVNGMSQVSVSNDNCQPCKSPSFCAFHEFCYSTPCSWLMVYCVGLRRNLASRGDDPLRHGNHIIAAKGLMRCTVRCFLRFANKEDSL
jgi:hypothetical protein